MMRTRAKLFFAAAMIASATQAHAHAHAHARAHARAVVPAEPPAAADQTAVREPAAVVDGFHAALGSGDVPGALAALADDAVIFESGGVERGKAEYAAHHAPADAAFAKAVPGRIIRRSVAMSDDTAWVLSEGRTQGAYKGKSVDRVTTETMLLRRKAGAWQIVHIHWSSAAAPLAR